MKTADILEIRHSYEDPERGAAVERGLRLIADAPALWMVEDRATRHIERRLRGFDKCGKDAFYRPYEHKNHGPSYRWAYAVQRGRQPTQKTHVASPSHCIGGAIESRAYCSSSELLNPKIDHTLPLL